MSRIGRLPVEIPAGVDVKLDGNTLTVKGPKGTLTQEFHKDMTVAVEGNTVVVTRPSEIKEHKARFCVFSNRSLSLCLKFVQTLASPMGEVARSDGEGSRGSQIGTELVVRWAVNGTSIS